MKMKMLAIAAVLAIAFAVLAFVPAGADNNDAAVSATEISLSVDAIDVYLDAGNTDDITVRATVKVAAPAPTGGDTVTLTATSSTADIIAAIAEISIPIAAGEKTGYADFTVSAGKVGTTTLTIADKIATGVTKAISVNVKAPSITVKNINVLSGENATGSIIMKGNVGQAFNLACTGITFMNDEDGTADSYEATLEKTTEELNIKTTAAVSDLGVTSKTITAENQSLTSTISIFCYDKSADAVVQGYGIDTTEKVQVITYTDGTALLNLSALDLKKNSHVKVTITYGTGDAVITQEVKVAAQKLVWLDLRGLYDAETPFAAGTEATATNIAIIGIDDNTLSIAAFGLSEFVLIMNANNYNGDAGFYEGNEALTEEYIDMANSHEQTQFTAILKKDHVLTTDEIKQLTPTNPGYIFKGYAIKSAADAPKASVKDVIYFTPFSETVSTDTFTIEDLIFAYGIGYVNTSATDTEKNRIYAVWEEQFFHVYLGYENNAYLVNQAYIALGDTPTPSATEKAILVKAPSSAKMVDVVLVRMSQTAALVTADAANSKILYTVEVHKIGTTEGSIGDIIDIQPQMLANGIFTLEGINQDVILVVKATATSELRSGYDFAVQSVKNVSGTTGTAIATFTVNDAKFASGAEMSMTGTYFKTISGHKVYGNIDNLADNVLTYSGLKNYNVVDDDAVDGTIAIADGVEFSLKMTSTATADSEDIIGFYAVKAVFTLATDVTEETPYALGEVA